MKFITYIFLTFALALGVMLTSCKAFTKSDAQALGVQIAKSSLVVASQMAAGQPVDVKSAVALIGLQAASSAIATVNYNLSSSTATSQSIIKDAHEAAQSAIANAAVPDPKIAEAASKIATQALNAAQDRLGADGSTSGK